MIYYARANWEGFYFRCVKSMKKGIKIDDNGRCNVFL